MFNYKISVNIAKFKGREFFWKKVINGINRGPSMYGKGIEKINGDSSSPKVSMMTGYLENNANNHSYPNNGVGALSFKEVLVKGIRSVEECENIKGDTVNDRKSCSVVMEKDILHTLKRCVVGKTRGLFDSDWLQKNFHRLGWFFLQRKN